MARLTADSFQEFLASFVAPSQAAQGDGDRFSAIRREKRHFSLYLAVRRAVGNVGNATADPNVDEPSRGLVSRM